MSRKETYTIGELARAENVTTRTVRYYVAEGLLPAPDSVGRAATYSDEHLVRLKLIKILKDEYLPLHEIRMLLSGLDYQAVMELLEQKQKEENPPPAPSSAKEYLQTLLHPPAEPAKTPSLMRHKVKAKRQRSRTGVKSKNLREAEHKTGDYVSRAAPAPMPDAEVRSAPLRSSGQAAAETADLTAIDAEVMELGTGASLAAIGDETSSSAPIQSGELQAMTRWQRIQITPDIELHVKEGLEESSLWQKIEQFVKIARQILSSIV
jgi:DNA-binding transcriptional MerR regulator